MPNRDWSETKPMLMQTWPGLPESLLNATQGNRDALLDLVTSQVGLERAAAEAELDALLGDVDDVPVAPSTGRPLVNGQPPDAANAREAPLYAAGEQGTSGIGQGGTPAADASVNTEREKERQRRAS